jgi:large subunit ribosomal protein L18
MDVYKQKATQRKRRHRRVRKKIAGTQERPRLCVFKSARHIYAQLIDDSQGRTLVAASSRKLAGVEPEEKAGRKTVAAREVGKQIADAAKQHGIQRVSFDRGGYHYHGRVAALADGARAGGLEF